jgi:hypothetical protein
MFILILTIILVLPGVFLPLALKSLFSSDELIEMGVYLEESQSLSFSSEEQSNCSRGNLLCPWAIA